MDDRDFLQKNWHQVSDEAIYWNQMSNTMGTEIDKQFLAISSLLIPLVGSVIFNTNTHLADYVKVILAGSIISLLASAILSIISLYRASRFFNTYTQHNSNRARIYHRHIRLGKKWTDAEGEIDKLDPLPNSTGDGFFVAQAIVFGIGVALAFIVVFILLLFK